MSVIIRLQGLPWTANATDIRRFFQGLSIPDGGVHIVGGEKGDAFIAFSTDEDARRAMMMNNTRLNDSPIQLLLSSKTEMQNIISVARGNQVLAVPNMAHRNAPNSFARPSGMPANAGSGFPSVDNHQTGFSHGSKEMISQGGGDFMHSRRGGFPGHSQFSGGQYQKSSEISSMSLDTRSRGFDFDSGHDGRHPSSFSDRTPNDEFRGRDSMHMGEFTGREGNRGPNFGGREAAGNRFPSRGDGFGGRDKVRGDAFGRQDVPRDDFSGRDGPNARRDGPHMEGYDKHGFHGDHQVDNESFGNRRFDSNNFRDNRSGFPREGPMSRDNGDFNQRNMMAENFERAAPVEGFLDRSVNREDSFGGEGRDFDFGGNQFSHDWAVNELDHPGFDAHGPDSWRPSPQKNEPQERFGRFSERNMRGIREKPRERDSFRDNKRGDFEHKKPGERKPPREKTLCVRASGMPWTVSYKEVRRFFGGLEIPRDGLKLINDKKGRRVGVCYVKFSTFDYAFGAIKRNGKYMGERYVDVGFCSEKDFQDAVDSYVPGSDAQSPNAPRSSSFTKRDRSRSPLNRSRSSETSDRNVIMKNLPSKTEKKDIVEFFSDLKVDSNSIYAEVDSEGKVKGSVYIEFSSSKICKEALGYHKKTLKDNVVEIYAISKVKMDEFIKRNKDSQNESSSKRKGSKEGTAHSSKKSQESSTKGKEGHESSHSKSSAKVSFKFFCVRLRGLPFQVTVRDIKSFFQGLEIPQRGIHIVLKQDGSAHGTGFVQFVSSRDCEKALEKDKQYIGKRYINVEPLSKGDMMAEIQELHAEQNIGQRLKPAQMPSDVDSRVYDSDSRVPRDRFSGRPSLDYQREPQNFDEPRDFDNIHSDFDIRDRGDHDSRGPSDRFFGDRHVGQDRFRGQGPFDDMDSDMNRQESFDDGPAVVLGAKNVHFRSTIDDILDFFRGFHAIPDSVRIHYTDRGKPTGDALIGFETVEDAEHALRELNGQMLLGRNVHLYFT